MITEKKCPQCNGSFVTTSKFQKFCSTNCRVKNHQQKKKEIQIETQNALTKIRSLPLKKRLTERLIETNPVWLSLDTREDEILKDLTKLNNQKEVLNKKMFKITSAKSPILYSILTTTLATSVIGGIYFINKKQKASKNEIIFWFFALLAAVGMGAIIGHIAKKIDNKSKAVLLKIENINNEIAQINTQITILEYQLQAIKNEKKSVPKILRNVERTTYQTNSITKALEEVNN